MKIAARILIISLFFLVGTQAQARIKWKEPKVVTQSTYRPNRRIIKFSGKTTPNSLVRIRDNKIKLYLDSGKARVAKIPQKDRVQFPLQADKQGFFSFRLYLPTVAVEIPVQVRGKKRWVNHRLNYRVSSGRADRLKAEEASFKAVDNEISKIDRKDNYYSRKHDKGMKINDRDGTKKFTDARIEAWGGLGFSYFDIGADSSSSTQTVSSSGSTLVIPTFRFGVDWKQSDKLLVKAAVRSTSGSTDEITGGANEVTGKDFSWLEIQGGVVWFFSEKKKKKKGRFGLDVGLQLQQLPFFRERPGFVNYSYFDNNTWNLHVGAYYQGKFNRKWKMDAYARYLYTLSTGDAFEMNTSFPLLFEFGGGVKKRLTEGLSMGVFGQLDYFSTSVKYTNNATSNDVDLNLMLLTVDVRLIGHF